MNIVKFSEIKNELQLELEKRLKESPILGEAGFTLIDGFSNLSLQTELSNSVIVGGPSIPMVAIVGNTSGRVYTFALKAILPRLWETKK